MKFKKDTDATTIGFLPSIIVIIFVVLIHIPAFIYKYLIKKPVESFLNWLIEPMLTVLDNEKTGMVIIWIFLLEILLTLIVPWFFNVWVGVGFLTYFLLYLGFVFLIIDKDDVHYNKFHIAFFLTISIPYLILLLLPSMSIIIFSKKPEKQLTLLETRIIKLKKLKKKVRRNKFKFWK